jgi:hypothetical protein
MFDRRLRCFLSNVKEKEKQRRTGGCVSVATRCISGHLLRSLGAPVRKAG